MFAAEELRFQYPGATTPALDGASFSVPSGQALGLLGPNGAGKTTFISMAMGLLMDGQGSLTFEGEPLAELRRHAPHLVGYVPQDHAFYPMLTVRENLRFFAEILNVRGARWRDREAFVLNFAQLEAFTARRADTLSGGLKRRLNLAIGLLGDPRLLLLDEPTVGVDPQSRHFLLESIRQLQQEGRTLLYTSHYMDEIEALCGYVAILDHGRVLVAGSLGEVLATVPPMLTLRAQAPLPPSLLAQWQPLGLQSLPNLCFQLPGIAQESVATLIAQAQQEGANLAAWSWGRQHLDAVFMQLTHRELRDT